MKKPKAINYPFKVNHKKLWALNIPTEEIEISELGFNFDIPYLEKEGTDDWNLSINQLLENLEIEPSHANKINKADLSYPIDLYFYTNEWIILDGVHRLAKALLLKNKTILVRRITEKNIDKIKNS